MNNFRILQGYTRKESFEILKNLIRVLFGRNSRHGAKSIDEQQREDFEKERGLILLLFHLILVLICSNDEKLRFLFLLIFFALSLCSKIGILEEFD